MKITNPTGNDISVVFEGTDYSVEANGSVEVSAQVAEFWTGIHGFLVASVEEVKEVKKTVKKAVKEVEDKE